jgi:hypothetical protein
MHDELSIHTDCRGTVKVEATSITSSEVGVHVDATVHRGEAFNHAQSIVELAQLVVTCRTIAYDINSSHSVVTMRILKDPHLFTDLTTNRCIMTLNYCFPHLHRLLSLDILDDFWQLEVD